MVLVLVPAAAAAARGPGLAAPLQDPPLPQLHHAAAAAVQEATGPAGSHRQVSVNIQQHPPPSPSLSQCTASDLRVCVCGLSAAVCSDPCRWETSSLAPALWREQVGQPGSLGNECLFVFRSLVQKFPVLFYSETQRKLVRNSPVTCRLLPPSDA